MPLLLEVEEREGTRAGRLPALEPDVPGSGKSEERAERGTEGKDLEGV